MKAIAHRRRWRCCRSLRSGSLLLLPVFQWQINDYIREEQKAQIVLGLFYGTLLLIMLYNLGVWFLVRDYSHLFYTDYVFTVALYQASLHGVGFQYLWHDSPFLADRMLALADKALYRAKGEGRNRVATV